MRRQQQTSSSEKQLPSIANRGYFSDYFLGYRLDSGLEDLYKQWEEAEKLGDPTPRTRVRSLSTAFDKYRTDAAATAPDLADNDTRLNFGISLDDAQGLIDLNDAVLDALGWSPVRDEPVQLTSGENTLHVPVAHRCETSSGLLLLALDAVFATDPATVVAHKTAATGTLLQPVRLGGAPDGRSALEAAQLIFTADEPPAYLLICSGAAITLLDRDRWGEGVYLGANLDNAVARADTKAKGELAAIAALFSADAINPGGNAESVLAGLVDRAANESAGVSKDLRYGIRRSVELLAKAVVADIRYRQKGAWQDLDPSEITRQCLRYLYRIIVLLYAEARPELGILPANDRDYLDGYSLARLRDAALIKLQGEQARGATHIQRSLTILFILVNDGYEPDATLGADGRELDFPGLGSQLFSPSACPLLDRARIDDHTLQQVIAHLCFSRERRGRDRQSLSYATLGINQLGAVYEGLMAYRGILAPEALYEIDDDGDPDTGTWVVPVDRSHEFDDECFIKDEGPDGQPRRVRYEEGDFVFRLAGRDRQRSASYYSPEVLTEFAVRHALDTYWTENPGVTARDILHLTVAEPALGSGAFLNEAVNQLAARYLKTAQDERNEIIDPDKYPFELQQAKAHFAINQAYGVDLNSTAVELAEVSLWLNCMYPGLRGPRFGSRLRQGNSLIGCRRATYTREQVKNRRWFSFSTKPAVPPTEHPLHEVPFSKAPGIHHFLVPGEGWGIAANATELKGKGGKRPEQGLAEDWAETVRAWRKAIQAKPSDAQLDRLAALSRRVESAWATAAREAAQNLLAHQRHIPLWGADTADLPDPGTASGTTFKSPEGPVARLRLLMDAWCALWMWGPANGEALPTLDEWLDAAELLLGQPDSTDTGQLFAPYELHDGSLESVELFGRARIDQVIDRHPWLLNCQEISDAQSFFHWELEFAPLFLAGGFHLQIGNPPWVRPRWSDDAALAEHDPFFAITSSITQETREQRRAAALAERGARAQYASELAENEGLNALLGAVSREPLLGGQQNNLYLQFITNCWRRQFPGGIVTLLHPDGFLSDPKAADLRREAYGRYRRHFHFINELMLFKEISHTREYGVHVYGSTQESPKFLQTAFLYHPSVVDRSLVHDGTGEYPGRKLVEGAWDLRPHVERLVHVDRERLESWAQLMAYDDAPSAPVVRVVTSAEAAAADAIAAYPKRFGAGRNYWSAGFHEKSDQRSGLVEEQTDTPSDWNEVILQGPHIGIGTPFAKQPRLSGRNAQDYERWDLEQLPESVIPRTNWQRKADRRTFEAAIPVWNDVRSTCYFRLVARTMLPSNMYRKVFVALIPPKASTMSGCYTGWYESDRLTAAFCGLASSLLCDFGVLVSGVSNLHASAISRFPAPDDGNPLLAPVVHRTLRLNCLTKEFAELWSRLVEPDWEHDDFTQPYRATRSIKSPPTLWNVGVPIRTELDRWLLLTELDALTALILGVESSGLAGIYNSQFSLLRSYEHQMVFDANGRQLCGDWHQHGYLQAQIEAKAKESKTRGWVKTWDRVLAYMDGDDDVDLGPFVPPFQPADRVAAMTVAYDVFRERYRLGAGASA